MTLAETIDAYVLQQEETIKRTHLELVRVKEAYDSLVELTAKVIRERNACRKQITEMSCCCSGCTKHNLQIIEQQDKGMEV